MSFEEIYTGKLFGAIRGFDRLRFRGTIRELNTGGGITRVLNYLHILMKDFKFFFKSITDTVVLNAKGYCQAKGIQYIWRMGETDKDAMAKALLAASPEGPRICR